jgi:5-methylcytosine-specific restriction endonuclease McrA
MANSYQRRMTRALIFARDVWLCVYCNKRIYPHTGTLEHVIPKSQKGRFRPNNLVLACHECNTSRSSQPILVWMAKRLEKMKTQGIR